MAGRDLLYTHIALGPDRLVQERSEWAPVVTSLPVTRAISDEIAVWSARLAPFTAWLAGLATPHISRRLGRSAVRPVPSGGTGQREPMAASCRRRAASGT